MIIVVTGLPRSGTTLMMRMLEAGGMPLYYDRKRPAKFVENGIRYYNHNVILRETDNAPKLKDGNGGWLKECEGMAVKILIPTERRPPIGFKYKFIYMDRKIKHMANSQLKYTRENNKVVMDPPQSMGLHQHINETRGKGIAMLKKYPKSSFILIRFEDALKNPKGVASRIVQFLNIDLDIDKMVSVVWKRPTFCMPELIEEQIYANNNKP